MRRWPAVAHLFLLSEVDAKLPSPSCRKAQMTHADRECALERPSRQTAPASDGRHSGQMLRRRWQAGTGRSQMTSLDRERSRELLELQASRQDKVCGSALQRRSSALPTWHTRTHTSHRFVPTHVTGGWKLVRPLLSMCQPTCAAVLPACLPPARAKASSECN